MGKNEVTKMPFLTVAGLEELEQRGKWKEAINLLYELWKNDPNDVSKLNRIIAECWYVLAFFDCSIDDNTLSYRTIQIKLIETTNYGLAHHLSDVSFLSFTGYMINLFPHFFCEEETDECYGRLEKQGEDMMLSAVKTDPANIVAKVLYLGTQKPSSKYMALRSQVKRRLDVLFPNKSAIEWYFREVLSSCY